jgi:hypothetical protein
MTDPVMGLLSQREGQGAVGWLLLLLLPTAEWWRLGWLPSSGVAAPAPAAAAAASGASCITKQGQDTV